MTAIRRVFPSLVQPRENPPAGLFGERRMLGGLLKQADKSRGLP